MLQRWFQPTTKRTEETTVAIACQGGGSHAAFTAGALGHLLDHLPGGYRVCGLSGASGGAITATAAGYGLLSNAQTPKGVLEGLWSDIAATTGWEQWVNTAAVVTARLDPGGLLTPSLSPYLVPDGSMAHQQLSTILSEHIGFDEFQQLLATDNQPPHLFVGAVDPLNGYPATFTNEGVTLDAVLATALPTLFRAVEINDRPYWDGVFAQNPPIRQFVTTAALPPIDELWIVQLTPQSVDETPTTTEAIADRMAQLVGNLSLQHERVFIEIVSEWAANGYLPEDRFATTTIRTIDLPQDKTAASTVDRRRSFVESLFADGRTEAIHLLEQLETTEG